MDQRVQVIAEYQRAVFDIAELARRYGISRKTAYTWIERYEIGGPAGLVDRSRRPAHCPHRTPIAALLEVRRHHPTWGAKKLLKVVATRQPTWTLPARSTVCDLLDRAGLITAPGRRRVPTHPGRPLIPMTAPNGTWTADFKGQFKARNGVYCYPLTVVDGFSRYLLACHGLLSTAIATAGRSSSTSSKRTACRESSEPTTACPSRPRRSGDYPHCPSGGFGLASSPS